MFQKVERIVSVQGKKKNSKYFSDFFQNRLLLSVNEDVLLHLQK